MCCDGILYHKAVTKGPFYQKRGGKGKGKRQLNQHLNQVNLTLLTSSLTS